MNRLKLLIVIFILALAMPLGYFILHTYQGLGQEEIAAMKYFAETLFDRMEAELAELVRREETRPVDEYGPVDAAWPSPLAAAPAEPYIVGYFQNNPDGSFHTPFTGAGASESDRQVIMWARLRQANEIFNTKRTLTPEFAPPALPPLPFGPPPPSGAAKSRPMPPKPEEKADKEASKETSRDIFAERYLSTPDSRRAKAPLGQTETRVQTITPEQAFNVAQLERDEAMNSKSQTSGADMPPGSGRGYPSSPLASEMAAPPPSPGERPPRFEVEIDPLQAVAVGENQVYLFRRIVIGNQVFRQGVVIRVDAFLKHLAETYFVGQPLAAFTRLRLTAVDQGAPLGSLEAGESAVQAKFRSERVFPRPFAFLKSYLTWDRAPASPGRATLGVMTAVLAGVILLGLFAIYRSASVVLEHSKRRSGFVSSVTHELKTPLTNIRMYIEMLAEGYAADDPDREQDYFRIVNSESTRLSRLINNVLEFSKLENHRRQLNIQTGTLEEVIREVLDAMGEKIRQEGFTLTVKAENVKPFRYDREVMVQVLINLIENSLKFGHASLKKEIRVQVKNEGDWAAIRVSDTGPGIPHKALKKVFEDFYRVDDSLTRSTRGAGIGLALVRQFAAAMGGKVRAENNAGPGCTVTVILPME